MSNRKKYSAYAARNADGLWDARVIRRKKSIGSVVVRELAGFSSHECAQAWATEQLAVYLAHRKERISQQNAQRSAKRIRQAARAAVVEKYSFRM